MKTFVVVSNPFGYGPSGKAQAIIETLKDELGEDKLVFIGSDLCLEIITCSGIEVIKANERDPETLRQILANLPRPYIISSQNRFVIKVARELGLPCAFIDGLAWFWPSIPADHLLADHIFWLRYPGIENRIPKGHNIHLVGAIPGSLPKWSPQGKVVVHLGGGENPLTNVLPYGYLRLLASLLNALPHGYVCHVTGGSRAMEFLRRHISHSGCVFGSYQRSAFLSLLSSASHFVTTAGQCATLEAFAMGVPTSFLLPSNLSQQALTDILKPHKAAPQVLEWEEYVSVPEYYTTLSERAAIELIETFSKDTLANAGAMSRLRSDFVSMMGSVPSAIHQHMFVTLLGDQGSKEIVEGLRDVWSFH